MSDSLGRRWFRVYSRGWRRLVVLASDGADALDRADRRWRALKDKAVDVRPAGDNEAAEHQTSERWAGITVRGRANPNAVEVT